LFVLVGQSGLFVVKNRFSKLVSGIVVFCLCSSASAAFLDFTDTDYLNTLIKVSDSEYTGIFDGVGYTLTSTNGNINLFTDGGYDGSDNSICQSGGGVFACGTDGIGIDDDEIGEDRDSIIETLTITFDTAVNITGFHFIDLYEVNGTEQATVLIDGTSSITVDATQGAGEGGYANAVIASMMGTTIVFTAESTIGVKDDANNNYALAGVNVSAVPIPAAAWLFLSGFLGLIGFSARKKST
jgi:hypothetical protein